MISRDASHAAVAERDLARFYAVLRRELEHAALTEGELRVVREGLALAGARRWLGHRPLVRRDAWG